MTRICHISAIKISPNRQRREFHPVALQELVESIQKNGLFHPLGVRSEGDQLILVHGERRLRAITDIYDLGGRFKFEGKELAEGLVPYSTLGELNELEREEAELAENIHRTDLTWQERASATARLAALRGSQAAAVGEPAPTVAAISEEVRGSSEGVHHDATRKELIIAKHLDKPEVKEAKTLADAWKALKKKEEKEQNIKLAAAVGKTFTADVHRLFNADSREWLKEAAGERFDVIITDPPYGMGADEFGDSGGKAAGAHDYTDTEEYARECYSSLVAHAYRLGKVQSHLYCFCDLDLFHWLRQEFARFEWWVHRTPLIWHKPHAARVPWPQHGPQRKYELILYAVKGKRPVTHIASDVIEVKADENLGHAAQKPVALYSELLRRSCRPGDSVLDPFAGSCPIFPAAHQLQLTATAVEADAAAYAVGFRRLEALKTPTNPIDPLEGLL